MSRTDVRRTVSQRRRLRQARTLAVAASVAAVVSVVGGRAGAGVSHEATPAHADIYVVRPGDTVWSIAQGLAGPGADPRPLVDRLITANHVSSGLVTVGERLAIPPGI